MRAVAWAIGCAVVTLPVWAAPPEGGVSLDQLMAALRAVRHVDARYVEHRTLQALRGPIETSGTLRYNAPDRLEKATDPTANQAVDRLMIQGNQLTIDRGAGAAPVTLMLNEHPEIGVLVESIRATLAGDGSALQRIFDVSLAGTLDGWQLVLQPHDPSQRAILRWMRITGYGPRIAAIDTQDDDGDHSEMTIVDRVP